MQARVLWNVVKEAVSDFSADDATSYGAALAFYAALSLAPLILILIWIASLSGEHAQHAVIQQVTALVGSQAGETVNMIVENAEERPSAGSIGGMLGIAMLIFSASGVFGQLQHTLNVIWEVKPKPGSGVWRWLKKRLLSAGMLFSLCFLLMLSLFVSTVLQLFLDSAGQILPGAESAWVVVNVFVSIAIFTLCFAALFKFIPDAEIGWHDVWLGAIVTAVLFKAGEFGLGVYLGRSSMGSSYGVAGSFVLMLVWVYYASLILFFGAELTQAWAKAHGHEIKPEGHAEERPAGTEKESPIAA